MRGTRNALLTDKERKALGRKNLDRRQRHKIERRISRFLNSFPGDLNTLFFSKNLTRFNFENRDKWGLALLILRNCFENASDYSRTIDIQDISVVTRNDRNFYYARRYNVKITMVTLPGSSESSPMLEGVEIDDKTDTKQIFANLDDPSRLKEILSLKRIEGRYAISILKKALRLGYDFPQSEKDAVPLTRITQWLSAKKVL